MQWLSDIVEKYGLILSDAQAEYSKFAVAAKAAGSSTEETRQIFIAMSEASRVMKWSADEFNGAMNAVSQMMSKQKITAEELQNQLGERMPNAIGAFAESIRKPNESLADATVRMRKLMEQGQLTSEMILGFANVVRNQMGDQAAKAAHQLQSEFNRLITTTENLRKQFMVEAEGGIRDAIVELNDVLKGEAGAKLVEGFTTAIMGLVKAMRLLVENIDTVVTVLELFLGYKLAKLLSGAARSVKDFVGEMDSLDKIARNQQVKE
jgi:tape measure domain-containing protein